HLRRATARARGRGGGVGGAPAAPPRGGQASVGDLAKRRDHGERGRPRLDRGREAHHPPPHGGAGRRPGRRAARAGGRRLPHRERAAAERRARAGRAAAPGRARARAAPAAWAERGGASGRAPRRGHRAHPRPRPGLAGGGRGTPRRDPALRDRARARRGDGADARGPPRAPHAPPPLRSRAGARVRRGGRGHGRRPARLGPGAHRGGARGLPRAGGQPEEVRMSEIGNALARELGRDRVADDAAALGARGYTTGHYPQSIDRSTVGGWVATRAAGQFSTRYGNIEDLCLGLEAVLPSGAVVRMEPVVPRASVGPNLRELFLGSEGALGVVTEVTLRVHPLPEARALASFAFPSLAAALDTVRRVLRVGWRPAVLRAYDQVETARQFAAWAPAD